MGQGEVKARGQGQWPLGEHVTGHCCGGSYAEAREAEKSMVACARGDDDLSEGAACPLSRGTTGGTGLLIC